MTPAPRQGHPPLEHPRQLLVGRVPVDHQHLPGESAAEHRQRSLGAARWIDMEVHRLRGNRDPQPGTTGTAALAQRLDAPAGLVAVTHGRGVLVLQDRLSQRLEQGHEARDAVAKRAGRERQTLPGQPA